MRLTTRGRYAVTALLDLALQTSQQDSAVSLSDIAKPLDQIDVMSIISAVDESVNAMQCEGRGDCQGGTMCLTHDLWCALSNHVEQYLKNITLAQLLNMEHVQSVSDRQHSDALKDISIKDINTITLSTSEANPA